MSDISAVIHKFMRITGRKVSDFDRERIQSIADALKIDSDDAFLQLVILLDMYWGIYRQYPLEIKQAIRMSGVEIDKHVKHVCEDIDAIATQKKNEIENSVKLSKSILADIQNKIETLSSKVKICICIAILGFFFLSCGLSYFAGNMLGIQKAVNIEREFKNQDAFLQTSLYSDTYSLYQSGELEGLIRCEMVGWIRKDGWCIAYPNREKDGGYTVARWRIADDNGQ